MVTFLRATPCRLLSLKLSPTLPAEERHAVSTALAPLLERSNFPISFSRCFRLTASQLRVFLLHRDHPYRDQFAKQWSWFTYFFNALAGCGARAFEAESSN